MPQPSAQELVTSRKAKARELMAQIETQLVKNYGPGGTADWADAGDLQRVIDGLTEALRVLTNGEG